MIKKKGKFEVFSASGLDRGTCSAGHSSAENKGLISSGQQDLPKE